MQTFRNLNVVDQMVRLVVAGICIYYGFIDTQTIQDELLAMGVGFFGVLNVIAGLMGFCPVYKIAGINTCAQKDGQ